MVVVTVTMVVMVMMMVVRLGRFTGFFSGFIFKPVFSV
jgi:hypothetical protein